MITALVGWLVELGWNGNRPVLAFMCMVAASALCLALGAAWLSGFIGLEKAITAGILPFILGDTLKSAFAVATLMVLARKAKA